MSLALELKRELKKGIVGAAFRTVAPGRARGGAIAARRMTWDRRGMAKVRREEYNVWKRIRRRGRKMDEGVEVIEDKFDSRL